MSITFTALSTYEGEATGAHKRRLRAFGIAVPGVVCVHRRRLRAIGVAVSGTDYSDTPEVPCIAVHQRRFSVSGITHHAHYETAEHRRRVRGIGFAATGGLHHRRVRGVGLPTLAGEGYAFIATQPMFISGFTGMSFEALDETIDAALEQRSLPIYGLVEQFRLDAVPDDTLTGLARAVDRIELGDALLVILRELLAEGFVFGATPAANFTAVERLLDALAMSGVAGSSLEAANILAVTIAFGDLLRSGVVAEATDGLKLGDALSGALQAATALVDGLLAGAEGAPSVRFGALVEEGVLLSDTPGNVLEAVELLREGITFALHLSIDDGHYVAYSINTENKAVTEYTNYPFNSFAKLGDRYFGMMPDGIRALEGDDDAGSPIAARFRLALTNLGSGQLKRMQAAYIGYTSTGELRIKTIVVALDGKKEAHYYRLHAQEAAAPRQARVKVGQGLRSVYWGFEIEAIDGAAFMIDLLDLHPLAMTDIGRIQGEGGGKR